VWFLSLAIVVSLLLTGAWVKWATLEYLAVAWLGLVALLMVGVPWLRRCFSAGSPVVVSPLAWLLIAVAVFGLVSFAVSVHRGATLQELLRLTGLLGMFLFALRYAGSEHHLHTLSWVLFGTSVVAVAAGIVLYVLSPRVATVSIVSLAHALVVRDDGGRFSAFFSYPNALAGFLILPMCIGVGMFAFGRHGRERLLGLTGTIVLMGALVLTGSRGGLIVAAGVLLLLPVAGWLCRCVSGRQMANIVITYGVVAVVVVASVAVPVSRDRLWKPLVQRFAAVVQEVSQGQATTGGELGGRLQMFRDLGPYLREYPVLGSGLGTYSSVYMKFRSQLSFAADPHSLVVKRLAEGGVIGFALELAMVGVLLWLGLRASLLSSNRALTFVIVMGTAGTLVHSCFDIDSMFYVFGVVSAILLGSCAGLAIQTGVSYWGLGRPGHRTASPVPGAKHVKSPRPRSRKWLATSGLMVLGLATIVFALATSAEACFVAGLRRAPESITVWSVPREFEVAQRLNPLEARYPLQSAASARSIAKVVPAALAVTFRDQAKASYVRSVSLDPLSPAVQIQYAQFLYEAGDRDAVDVLQRLTTLDPIDPGTWTSLAHAHIVFNHNPELAEQALDQARRVDATYYDIANVTGQIALDNGDVATAEAAFRQSVKTSPSQQIGWSGLADVYRESGAQGKLLAALFDASVNAQEGSTFAAQLHPLAPMAQWASPAAGGAVAPGASVALAWNVADVANALEWQTIYAAPASGDWILVADGLKPSTRDLRWQIPTTVPVGACRFYLYLQAPKLMAGSDRGWVSYAVSSPVQVGQ
jgi:O-antigen ligase/Tfp pilus assembly protein PilF